MTGLFTKLSGKLRTATLLAVAATTGLVGFTGEVRAEDSVRVEAKAKFGGDDDDHNHGDRHAHDRKHHDSHHGGGHSSHRRGPRRYKHDHSELKIDIDFNTGSTRLRRETEYGPRHRERRVRYWVQPVYRTVTERVFVQPVYRTVTERVWVEPVYETVYEEVHVPARYEVREITKRRHGRKIVIRERVFIEPAHVERVPKQVCVSEGRWDVIEKRVCVSEGRWNVVERQVCVSEGRWDYRLERYEVSGHEEETLLDLRF